METLPETGGELLRHYRARAGTTQQELAALAGVSVRTLRELEHGRTRRPHARALSALAAALDLSPDERDSLYLALPRRGASGEARAFDDRLRVEVLGPLAVHRGADPVHIGPVKQRILLALLAIQPGQPVSREEIVDVLWPAGPPRTHLDLVHSYLARLRRRMAGHPSDQPARYLRSVGGGYLLALAADQLDVVRFAETTAQAWRAHGHGDHPAALARFADALRCWRDRAAADIGGLAQHPATVALCRQRVAAAVAYADLAIELGHYTPATLVLRDLVEAEPLHEGLSARLMLALAGAGEQAAALRLFAEVRSLLRDELGLVPGPELTAAHRRVLRQDLPGRGTAAAYGQAAHPFPAAVPAQLPPDIAGFIGRDAELRRLTALIPTPAAVNPTAVRVALVTGPPGVGKTALAIHWGHQVATRYPDGQLYLDLRGYSADPPLSPMDALRQLLVGCGVPVDDLPSDVDVASARYRSQLAGARMLVVLDNAASAAQVRPLLPGSGCLVLVTSRDRLEGLVARPGARRISLGMLTGQESAALLTAILGSEKADAEPGSVADLAELCGGLPLALRIAAAQLSDTPTTIAGYAAALRGGHLTARLTVDGDEVPAGVELAFDRSYAALPPAERRLFRLASLLPGRDFPVGAVASLCDLPRQRAETILGRLVRAHLVEHPVPDRYRFHDLIRSYAAHRCHGEDRVQVRAAALRRLVRMYAATATSAAQILHPQLMWLQDPATAGPRHLRDHAEALAWFDAERANLVTTVRALAPHPWPELGHLAYALRGHLEHRRRLDDLMDVAHAHLAVATATDDGRGQAIARITLAIAHATRAEFDVTRRGLMTALVAGLRHGWTDIVAVAHNNLGVVYVQLGQLDEAADHYRHALAGYRTMGWEAGQGSSLATLGDVCYRRGRPADAVRHLTEALAIAERTGAVGVAAPAREGLGRAYLVLGQTKTAIGHLTTGLAQFRQVGRAQGEAVMLQLLAVARSQTGELARAQQLAEAALAIVRDTRDGRIEIDIHNTLGDLHLRWGAPSAAEEAYRLARDLARARGHRFGEVQALTGLAWAQAGRGLAAAGLADGRRALNRARREGYLVLEGRAATALAAVYLSGGRSVPAIRHLGRALRRHRQTGDLVGHALSLAILGRGTR